MQTLQQNQAWADLIGHAAAQGCLLSAKQPYISLLVKTTAQLQMKRVQEKATPKRTTRDAGSDPASRKRPKTAANLEVKGFNRGH